MNRVLTTRTRRDLVALEVAIAVVAAGLPLALMGIGSLATIADWAAVCQAAIYVLTLVVAVLTGLVFPLAAKLDFQEMAATASRLYTADYLGAALGALLVSTMLIPLVGVTAVCLLAAGLNVLGGAALWLARVR
jgi:predicted membrane-bound spermidine synthase